MERMKQRACNYRDPGHRLSHTHCRPTTVRMAKIVLRDTKPSSKSGIWTSTPPDRTGWRSQSSFKSPVPLARSKDIAGYRQCQAAGRASPARPARRHLRWVIAFVLTRTGVFTPEMPEVCTDGLRCCLVATSHGTRSHGLNTRPSTTLRSVLQAHTAMFLLQTSTRTIGTFSRPTEAFSAINM